MRRVRRSTVGLAALFAVTLTTYLFVRPDDPTATRESVVPVRVVPSPPAASPTPPADPTPSDPPSPTDVPEPTESPEDQPSDTPDQDLEPTVAPTAPADGAASPEPSA